jgi:hypothetical protein
VAEAASPAVDRGYPNGDAAPFAKEASMIVATDWRPNLKGPRQGFLDLELQPSGLLLHGCVLMESNGQRWISLPARPQTHKDGSPVLDPRSGKQAWTPIVEIKDRAARERFQAAALDAVDRLLGGSAP